MKVVALTPDLADRARIAAAVPDAVFVGAAPLLRRVAEGADLVVVDLTRSGVLDALSEVVADGARVIGYGPHVDAGLLAAAVASGAEAYPRSRLFREGFLAELVGEEAGPTA